jgi:hypothetical protein
MRPTSSNGFVPRPRGEIMNWAVHVTSRSLSGDVSVGPIECLHSSEPYAREDACARSRDEEVVAASVTSYIVDRRGTRRRVALYVDGKLQKLPYCTDLNHEYVLG